MGIVVVVSCAPKHGGGKRELEGGKDKPGKGTEKPIEGGKDKPGNGTEKPIEGGKNKPGNGKDKPKPTPPPKPEKPCNGTKNVESCRCKDGETYDNKKDLRKNCKKDENPVVDCSCKDGSIWEDPAKKEKPEEDEDEPEGDEENPEEDEE